MANQTSASGTEQDFRPDRWAPHFSDLASDLSRFESRPKNRMVILALDPFRQGHDRSSVDAIFALMALVPDVLFAVITDHPDRMQEYMVDDGLPARVVAEGVRRLSRKIHAVDAKQPDGRGKGDPVPAQWPLPNVILGIEAGDTDRHYQKSIPFLLKTPAAKRCVRLTCSSTIDLGMSVATCRCCPRWQSRWVELHREVSGDFPFSMSLRAKAGIYRAESNMHGALSIDLGEKRLGIRPSEFECLPGLDWVLVDGGDGCDSPLMMHALRDALDQCATACIPAYVSRLGPSPSARSCESEWPKSWGSGVVVSLGEPAPAFETYSFPDQCGEDPEDWPEWARVRQSP